MIALLAADAHADVLRPVTSKLGWQVDLDTFVQVDAIPWAQSSQDELAPTTAREPLNEESLVLRRGFVRIMGRHDGWKAVLELNGNSVGGTPNARIQTASVGWEMPDDLLAVQAGLLLIPFGAGVPQNARDRDFMELPTFLRALFPGDVDAGVQARGSYGLLRWSIAAMNGAPKQDARWSGKDPSSSWDVMGRLGGELRVPTMWGRPAFTFGVSALTGEALHPGTAPTKDQLQWVDENQDGIVQTTELQVIPGMPGEPSKRFHHAALGIDASASWCLQWAGRGRAFAEAAISTNLDRAVYYADPVDASRDIRELGFQIGATQRLTQRGFVGVRYDRYDADRDAAQQLGVSLVGVKRVFSTWAFLAAATWGTTRVSAEYDHVQNPLGVSDTGMPTTRADDRFVLRAQAEF